MQRRRGDGVQETVIAVYHGVEVRRVEASLNLSRSRNTAPHHAADDGDNINAKGNDDD